jgi:gamma-glutamylcyclotransferase (GGCT)/AIG2-like uncharacterized protein YtfP
MLPLFAYGTLRDPDYQRELFARTFKMEPATVSGFAIRSTGGGYLAAAPQPGAAIAGMLVDLDAAAYVIADAWEDRSVYDRVEVQACRADGRLRRCFIYVQLHASGTIVADDRLADRPRAEVLADIRRFRASATGPQ